LAISSRKKVVGNLDQDAGTVAHQRVRTDGTPVIQVFQDQQALLDDRETLLAPDVRYKTDAAGVVLVGRVVKPLPFRYSRIHHARILIKPRRLPGDRWSATPQKPGTTAAGRSLRGTRDYTPNAPAVQDAAPHQAGAPEHILQHRKEAAEASPRLDTADPPKIFTHKQAPCL
jgi:hypothetical protein